MTKEDDFLEHFGVKGMRWGVRNRRGSPQTEKQKRASVRNKAKRMNDDDLIKAVKRLELEKKFIDLNKQTSNAGKTYAKSLLEQAGKVAVGGAVGTLVGMAIKAKFQKTPISDKG